MPEIDVDEGKISFFHGTDYSSAENIVNDGSFLTRWKVEFDSELTPKQIKAVIDFVKKYNSANPKWKAWTSKSLTEERIHNWNDSFRNVNVFTNNNRSLIFEFHCNPDETRWWREWLVLKFFPDLEVEVGVFKGPRILHLERFVEAMEEIGKNMNYEDVKAMRRESERKIIGRAILER